MSMHGIGLDCEIQSVGKYQWWADKGLWNYLKFTAAPYTAGLKRKRRTLLRVSPCQYASCHISMQHLKTESQQAHPKPKILCTGCLPTQGEQMQIC